MICSVCQFITKYIFIIFCGKLAVILVCHCTGSIARLSQNKFPVLGVVLYSSVWKICLCVKQMMVMTPDCLRRVLHLRLIILAID